MSSMVSDSLLTGGGSSTLGGARLAPIVTGLSPKEGVPGTQVTIRGENLGLDANDLLALVICGTDCLMTAKWKSSSKIIARIGQAKRGVGDVMIATKSGGRGVSNVHFRVFTTQVMPLEESAVWVDETRTVPGRETMRNVTHSAPEVDPLGLPESKKMDTTVLAQMFPEGSGNMRLENFVPAWYLLENHRSASVEDLRNGLRHMRGMASTLEQSAKDLHKANLYSLISCVDSLADLQAKLQLERNTRGWPLTRDLDEKMSESQRTADAVFHEVLSRKDRADATRNALSVLTRFRFIFFLPSAIDANLAKGEYGIILNDYTRAKSLFGDSEVALFREVMLVLEEKMQMLKRTLKTRLMDVPTSFEQQRKIIRYLQILEPESDPGWDCLTAHHLYLEQLLWDAQTKFFQQAKQTSAPQVNGVDGPARSDGRSRYDFVEAVIAILTSKLHAFWKLTQLGLAPSTTPRSQQLHADREGDVHQMLINTINVSSWLILNALVPTSLPDAVVQQYKEQFVKWPMGKGESSQLLFTALRQLRACICKLMEQQFSLEHVQPLVELCMTIRLKCLSILVENTRQGIVSLGTKENWKIELADNDSCKTNLPDFYDNELNEAMPQIKQILAHDGFRGELDLFSKDRFKEMLLDLFELLLTSIKECVEQLLQLRPEPRGTPQRPVTLPDGGKEQPMTSKKLLIAICNVEFIARTSLARVCRRFSEGGLKYADVVLQRSKQKLQAFRATLIRSYIGMKCGQFALLIDAASYDGYVPDDVSDYVKELVMCVVFIQAEIFLVSSQLIVQVMSAVVRGAFDRLIARLQALPPAGKDQATQIAVDISAFEESLHTYFTDEMKSATNALRASLLPQIDQQRFQQCLKSFRGGMRLAIESLKHYSGAHLDTSNI